MHIVVMTSKKYPEEQDEHAPDVHIEQPAETAEHP
jgi:hypothetical protein